MDGLSAPINLHLSLPITDIDREMGGGRAFVYPGSPISDGDSSDVVDASSLETEDPHFHGCERIRYSRDELLQLREAVEIVEDIIRIKQEFESEIKAASERVTMLSERARSIPCKAYLVGSCQFGSTCYFSHEDHYQRKGEIEQVELNSSGLPLRPGEKDCPYYVCTGICLLLTSCWFNHPDPTIIEQDLFSGNVTGGSPPISGAPQLSEMPKALNESISFANHSQAEIPFSQSLDSSSFGTDCQVPLTSALDLSSSATDGQSSAWNGSSTQADDSIQLRSNMDYTERHDQSDCTYFMKFGNCKFGSTCKFQHSMSSGLSGHRSQINAPIRWQAVMKDYTERPDQSECPYFAKYGTCQHGSTCKYKHPQSLALNRSQGYGPIQRQAHMDYIERHNSPDCTYFIKFGTCKFGSRCRYQHHNMSLGSKVRTSHIDDPIQRQARMEDYTEGSDQLDCPYFTTYGTCEYGSTCKYKHPRFLALNGPSQTDGPIQWQTYMDFTEGHPSPSKVHWSELDGPIQQKVHMENCTERPDQLDCPYFVKNGTCQFGSTCKYKHPQSSAKFRHPLPSASNGNTEWQAANLVHLPEVQMDEYPLRPGEPVCSYFIKYGTCKFKSACKFHHPSMYEYPQRPGEPECSHFTKQGACKFKYTCKFHHPAPSTLSGLTTKADGPIHQEQSGYPLRPGGSECAWVVKHGTSKCYHSSPTTLDGLTLEADGGVHHLGKMEHSERLGEPDCPSTMKFGHCSFGDACKYNHPNDCQPKVTSCIISPNGLPLRADQPTCMYYSCFGICKFGAQCKFNHPMDSGSSMPVANIASCQGSLEDESEC